MLLDKFQMIANCYGGSNVLHMLILHSKCSINIPTSCVRPGTCRNIWNVPNLLLAGKWQVLSTRACNVLKMFLLVSRPPHPQCMANMQHPIIRPPVFSEEIWQPIIELTTGWLLGQIKHFNKRVHTPLSGWGHYPTTYKVDSLFVFYLKKH